MKSDTRNIPCDVLLAEAGGHVGYQVMRDLVRHGLKVCICDTSDRGMSFASRYASGSFVCPDPVRDSSGYVRSIASEAASRGVKAVIPIFHPEVLSRGRKMLPEGVLLPVDTPEKLSVLDDKVKSSSLALSLGIRQPHMYDNPSEIKSWPVVFKRAGGLAGAGVYFPKDRHALDNLMRTAGKKGALVMDYIDGYDCCVDAFRWNGAFTAWAYRVVEPKRKGFSIIRESVDAPELINIAKLILEAIEYNGLCGCDFRIENGTGDPYFLECNPRFSGGLGSQLSSGFDLPWLLWTAAVQGEGVSFPEKYVDGKTTESLSVALAYINRYMSRGVRLSEIFGYFRSSGRIFDDVDLTDPHSLVRIFR